MPSKTGKAKDEKIIPYNVLKDLEAKGKYKRSDKLNSITDMLELVNTYTTNPKYVKIFFDYNRDDNLDIAVTEKIESIKSDKIDNKVIFVFLLIYYFNKK